MMQKQAAIPARLERISSKTVGLVFLFAALMALASFIRIPIPGSAVPLTLQVLIVLLAGAFLRPMAAASSMTLFVLAGMAGAPIFAGGAAGIAHLAGPTGGYLVGFIAAAAAGSFLLAGRRGSLPRLLLSMAGAVCVLHLFGALHLALWLGGDLMAAFRTGVLIFLPGDLLKIGAAAAIVAGASQGAAPGDGRS